MSGGSWDYLSGQDALPASKVMHEAAGRLAELGDEVAARDALALAGVLERAERTWEINKSLREALHDMEWVDSGDILPEDFTDAAAKRNAR